MSLEEPPGSDCPTTWPSLSEAWHSPSPTPPHGRDPNPSPSDFIGEEGYAHVHVHSALSTIFSPSAYADKCHMHTCSQKLSSAAWKASGW